MLRLAFNYKGRSLLALRLQVAHAEDAVEDRKRDPKSGSHMGDTLWRNDIDKQSAVI